jgi:mRNA interferase YafQ
MRDFVFSNQFKKDLKLMEKRHKRMDALYEIIGLLMWDAPLPERCREHGLSGTLAGITECHIEGDWVVLYEIDDETIYLFPYRLPLRYVLNPSP